MRLSKDQQIAELQENKDGRKTQSCLQQCCFTQATDKLKDRSRSPRAQGRTAEAAARRALSRLHCHGRTSTLFPQLLLTLHTHLCMDREARPGRHGPPAPTWACHFLQKPPAPLKVGTPLSALTPAPVMMAMCLALANTSRKSAMSVPGQGKQGAVQALTLRPERPHLCIQRWLPCTPPMTLTLEHQLFPEPLYVGILRTIPGDPQNMCLGKLSRAICAKHDYSHHWKGRAFN